MPQSCRTRLIEEGNMITINVMTKELQRTLNKRRTTSIWVKNNPDRVRANDRARYKRDKSKRDKLNVKWAKNNPEKIRSIVRKAARKWRKANLDVVRESDRILKRRLYSLNPERYRAESSARQKAHPEYRKIRVANRRARKLKAGGSFTSQEFRALGNICLCCGLNEVELIAIGRVLSPDHVIPLSKGGSNDIATFSRYVMGGADVTITNMWNLQIIGGDRARKNHMRHRWNRVVWKCFCPPMPKE